MEYLSYSDAKKIVTKLNIQKVKEWIIATRLERRYTKNEILTMKQLAEYALEQSVLRRGLVPNECQEID